MLWFEAGYGTEALLIAVCPGTDDGDGACVSAVSCGVDSMKVEGICPAIPEPCQCGDEFDCTDAEELDTGGANVDGRAPAFPEPWEIELGCRDVEVLEELDGTTKVDGIAPAFPDP